MQTKTVNEVRVKPYKGVDKRPYKYEDLFSHPYVNILIIGPKNTGKSQIAGSIILNVVSNKSVVRLFSSTMKADHTTSKTIHKLEKRGIDVETYESIDPGQLEGQLIQIREFVEIPEMKEKLEKWKFRVPLCVYVFDDFRSNFKRHPEISNLFTKNRHYRIITIISSQRYKDIQNCARMNTNVLILTKGLSEMVLKSIYEEQPMNISKEAFFEIYSTVTTEGDKYDFLFYDVDNGKFRINFDQEIVF